MAGRRDNDEAEITSLSPSIPIINLLATYGGSMSTTGATNNEWSYRTGANNMCYIHANSVANFNICGQLPMSRLIPRLAYKGMFELELTSRASGWQGRFVVTLNVPGSLRAIQPREYNYNRVGTFWLGSDTFQLSVPQRSASLGYTLSHSGQYTRTGLIVKRFVIQET